jgi:hypothetical protein
MTVWQSAAAMKRLATALLAGALVAVAVTLMAGQRMAAIQGPVSLAAIDAQTLWVGVNDELWIVDAQGRVTARRTAAELGLPGAVSGIAPGPGGTVVLNARNAPAWQVVDARTARPLRSIAPQWPAEFLEHLNAVHLAVAPDGAVAAATGGGHAVLLFGPDGRLRARTAPGTYRFTNGLWHSAEGWWTTDTNRNALHLLDGETLAPKRSVNVPLAPHRYRALGELVPSQGAPLPGSDDKPLATLTRLGFLMQPGHAADVFADGRQALYNTQPLTDLRDIAWFNGELLLVDGAGFRILRYGPDRQPRGSFGDAALQDEWQSMRARRALWAQLSSRWALLIAGGLLLAGLVTYARHRQLSAPRVAGDEPAAASAAVLVHKARRGIWLPLLLRLLLSGVVIVAVLPGLSAPWYGATMRQPAVQLMMFGFCVLLAFLPLVTGEERRAGAWDATLVLRETFAAFVVPGSGQWMQGRFVTGTTTFAAALLLAVFSWGPIVWALIGARMDIAAESQAFAFHAWLVLSLVSALDAALFRPRPPRAG